MKLMSGLRVRVVQKTHHVVSRHEILDITCGHVQRLSLPLINGHGVEIVRNAQPLSPTHDLPENLLNCITMHRVNVG